MRITLMGLIATLTGCISLPEGIEPVRDFELQRYLGTWYEIARLDHRFERNLQAVTAVYVLGEGESIQVTNRGFNTETGEWESAEGTAYFVRSPDIGFFKVSFFGPFYGAYVIFNLDHQNYDYAFVTGNSRDYLWLLARTPQVSETLKKRFIEAATALDYDTNKLIFVDHSIKAQ